MGFLNKLFGKGTEETDWVQLESEDAVEEVFAASGGRIQLILKHSQSCAVSFFAKQNLDSVPLEEWPEMDRSMVEVVRFRPISQYIAQKTSVRHESPQVLVIANREVIFHASHSEVNKVNIQQAYEKALGLL
jgi:bacillithiol system protein YtxJ